MTEHDSEQAAVRALTQVVDLGDHPSVKAKQLRDAVKAHVAARPGERPCPHCGGTGRVLPDAEGDDPA